MKRVAEHRLKNSCHLPRGGWSGWVTEAEQVRTDRCRIWKVVFVDLKCQCSPLRRSWWPDCTVRSAWPAMLLARVWRRWSIMLRASSPGWGSPKLEFALVCTLDDSITVAAVLGDPEWAGWSSVTSLGFPESVPVIPRKALFVELSRCSSCKLSG